MKVEIKIPSMGESITEVTIAKMLKESGSKVSADDELIELETDKVNQVLYASQAGVVQWNVKEGDGAAIGQVIGTIDPSNEPQKPSGKPSQENAEKKNEPEPSKSPEESKAPKALAPSSPTAEGARIFRDDYAKSASLKPALEQPAASARSASSLAETPKGERETRKKMSKVRKVIAARLVEVQNQTAMLTTFNEADMTQIMGLREQYKESFAKKYNTRLGFMSFFIKACVSALKTFQEVNAYIDGEDIVYRNYFDIGVAVGTERGVIVPVVRKCDQLTFAETEQAIEAYAKKAREGTLTANDLQGGSFTITNGGVYGSLLSTPIINPPQSAILGMHKISKRPVVIDDTVVIRQMMYLALSYDHRIIDGKEAVSFLVHIKNCLEDPSRLLLEV